MHVVKAGNEAAIVDIVPATPRAFLDPIQRFGVDYRGLIRDQELRLGASSASVAWEEGAANAHVLTPLVLESDDDEIPNLPSIGTARPPTETAIVVPQHRQGEVDRRERVRTIARHAT